jgi:hypothetical protein
MSQRIMADAWWATSLTLHAARQEEALRSLKREACSVQPDADGKSSLPSAQ